MSFASWRITIFQCLFSYWTDMKKMQYQHFLISIFPLPTRIWEQECLEMSEGLLGGQVNTDYVQATSAQGSNTGKSRPPFLLQSLLPTWTPLTHWGLNSSWATALQQCGCRYNHSRGQFPHTCIIYHQIPHFSQGKGCMSSFTNIFSGHGAEKPPVSCLELLLLCIEEKGSVFNLQQFGPPSQHLTPFWNKTFTQKLPFCPWSLPEALSSLHLTASTDFY